MREPSGGRTWWAHLAFTRMNIDRIILGNQIEEGMDVMAPGESPLRRHSFPTAWNADSVQHAAPVAACCC